MAVAAPTGNALKLAVALISESEGFKDKPYLCPAGYPTIGYGTRIKDLTHASVTREEALVLLKVALNNMAVSCMTLIKVPLKDAQWAAILSFVYNLGIPEFSKSTLLRKLNAGNYVSAASEFPRWNKATENGKLVVLPGLTRRRKAEYDLFTEAPPATQNLQNHASKQPA